VIGCATSRSRSNQGQLVALGAALAAFGGYLVRQFTKFKNRKIQFMKALSENLYFRNLDNDVGVFHHLLDAAEEEEVKESGARLPLPAHRGDGRLSAPELDADRGLVRRGGRPGSTSRSATAWASSAAWAGRRRRTGTAGRGAAGRGQAPSGPDLGTAVRLPRARSRAAGVEAVS
jgi:hypothetical protein